MYALFAESLFLAWWLLLEPHGLTRKSADLESSTHESSLPVSSFSPARMLTSTVPCCVFLCEPFFSKLPSKEILIVLLLIPHQLCSLLTYFVCSRNGQVSKVFITK